jgi:hypothetical protein
MSQANPYATSRNDPEFGEANEYPVIQNAYADPASGAPYGLPGSPYADVLRYERGATPDPTRIMREDITDGRQDPVKPKRWWQLRRVDQDERESVTQQTGTWVEDQQSQTPVVDRALGKDTVTRPYASTSPNNYSFTRPFTGGTPHRLNGIHFSMANHERYPNEIFGMVPPRSPRGTYRADVAGWSEGDVDKVEVDDSQYTYTMPTVPSTQRNFRAGG